MRRKTTELCMFRGCDRAACTQKFGLGEFKIPFCKKHGKKAFFKSAR